MIGNIKNIRYNQYEVEGLGDFYDTELLVYAATLCEDIQRHFGVSVHLNNDNISKAMLYQGQLVFGNITRPQKMYIKESWADKWELFSDNSICPTSYGTYTQEEIIDIAQCIADFLNTHDVLSESYNNLMSQPYDDNYTIAAFYKPFNNNKQ